MELLKKRTIIEYTEDETPFCRLDKETVSILGQSVVLTLGTNRTILVFPEKTWAKGLDTLQSIYEKHPEVGARFRFLVAYSITDDLSDGTMLLSSFLIEYANISSEAWLIAEDDKICLKVSDGAA